MAGGSLRFTAERLNYALDCPHMDGGEASGTFNLTQEHLRSAGKCPDLGERVRYSSLRLQRAQEASLQPTELESSQIPISSNSTTLPHSFHFNYIDRQLATPEPGLPTLLVPPKSPRPFRIKRRLKPTLSSIIPNQSSSTISIMSELRDTPVKSVEDRNIGCRPILERLQTPEPRNPRRLFRNPSPKTPTKLSDPKSMEVPLEPVVRSASVFSGLSDSDDSDLESDDYFSYGSTCTSPDDADQAFWDSLEPDKLPYAKNLDSQPQPKGYWTKAMDDHLYEQYVRYLHEPTATPFKSFPGQAPPLGVCHRVSSMAKDSWSNSKYNPTKLMTWPPHGSSCRRRLRILVKNRPEMVTHYQRILQNEHPSAPVVVASTTELVAPVPITTTSAMGLSASVPARLPPTTGSPPPLNRARHPRQSRPPLRLGSLFPINGRIVQTSSVREAVINGTFSNPFVTPTNQMSQMSLDQSATTPPSSNDDSLPNMPPTTDLRAIQQYEDMVQAYCKVTPNLSWGPNTTGLSHNGLPATDSMPRLGTPVQFSHTLPKSQKRSAPAELEDEVDPDGSSRPFIRGLPHVNRRRIRIRASSNEAFRPSSLESIFGSKGAAPQTPFHVHEEEEAPVPEEDEEDEIDLAEVWSKTDFNRFYGRACALWDETRENVHPDDVINDVYPAPPTLSVSTHFTQEWGHEEILEDHPDRLDSEFDPEDRREQPDTIYEPVPMTVSQLTSPFLQTDSIERLR